MATPRTLHYLRTVRRALKQRIVVIGGGTAGCSVAARLVRKGSVDVTVIEPSTYHHYQPAYTLVGAGLVDLSRVIRNASEVLPSGVKWIHDRVILVKPHDNKVVLHDGGVLAYDYLVVAPGIQLREHAIPGLETALGKNGVSTNYRPDLAPVTWRHIQNMVSGTAVFTLASGTVKCAGAGLKIAFLAADWWRRWGVRKDIDIHLVTPGDKIFGIPEYAAVLKRAAQRHGITLHTSSSLQTVDGVSRQITVGSSNGGETQRIGFDFLHAVPLMGPPDWVADSGLGDENGFVSVDPYTLRHLRFGNVFGLGDASSAPNAKTGAAVRKQAPVVVDGIMSAIANVIPGLLYGGYACCPIPVDLSHLLLAEFDYNGRVRRYPGRPRTIWDPDMRMFKGLALPCMYWNGMMRGRC